MTSINDASYVTEDTDYESIFMESDEDLGLLLDSYSPLVGSVKKFLDQVEGWVFTLLKNPSVPINGTDKTISDFKASISIEKKHQPIDLSMIDQLVKRVSGVKREIESSLGKLSRLKGKMSFGGKLMKSIILKPKVYSSEIDAEKYDKTNTSIRTIERALDWSEKAILDLFNLADQDLNVLTIVNRVYVKNHIYESEELSEGWIIPSKDMKEQLRRTMWRDLPKYVHKMIAYDDNDTTWKLRAPSETIDDKRGNCHDQAQLIQWAIDHSNGVEVETGQLFFIEYRDGSNTGGRTHTVTYVKKLDMGMNTYYLVESSWEGNVRYHGYYHSIMHMVEGLHKLWKKDPASSNWDGIKIFIRKGGYSKKLEGSSLKDYVAAWTAEDDVSIEESVEDSLLGDIIDSPVTSFTEGWFGTKYDTLENLLTGIKTPEKLLGYMKDNFKYGYADKTGTLHMGDDNIDTDYALQSPEELVRSNTGVCWDQTELEREWFDRNWDFGCSVYYVESTETSDCPSHTFLTFKSLTNMGVQSFWFENSWSDERGIHDYWHVDDLCVDVIRKFMKSHGLKDTGKVRLRGLTDRPKYGCTCQEFMKYARSQSVVDTTKILGESVLLESDVTQEVRMPEDTVPSADMSGTPRTPEALMDWMRANINYDKSISSWHLKDESELMRTRTGNCHDQSLFSLRMLTEMGYDSGQLFFQEYNTDTREKGNAHTLTWYEDNGSFCWFETSWETQVGIHRTSSVVEIKKLLMRAYCVDNDINSDYDHRFDMSKRKFSGTVILGKPAYTIGMNMGTYCDSWYDTSKPIILSDPYEHEMDIINAEHRFYVGDSKIAGKGTFASVDIGSGTVVGKAMTRVKNTGNPDEDMMRTELGQYTNHSDNPNLSIKKDGDDYLFMANKNISKNEELLVNYNDFDFPGKTDFNESYDPPLSYDRLPDHLKSDPVHAWRAKTGIELIHREPTADEFRRIWDNWQRMTHDQKITSDTKSIELFGKTNFNHYLELLDEYYETENVMSPTGNIMFYTANGIMDKYLLEGKTYNLTKKLFRMIGSKFRSFMSIKPTLANLQNMDIIMNRPERRPLTVFGTNIPLFGNGKLLTENTGINTDSLEYNDVFIESDPVTNLSESDFKKFIEGLRSRFKSEIIFVRNTTQFNRMYGIGACVAASRESIMKIVNGMEIDPKLPNPLVYDLREYDKFIVINPSFLSNFSLSGPMDAEILVRHEYGHVLTYDRLSREDWINYKMKTEVLQGLSDKFHKYNDAAYKEMIFYYANLKPEKMANEVVGLTTEEYVYMLHKIKLAGAVDYVDMGKFVAFKLNTAAASVIVKLSEEKQITAAEAITNIEEMKRFYGEIITTPSIRSDFLKDLDTLISQHRNIVESTVYTEQDGSDTVITTEESQPKQTDAEEEPKNGVKRKELYIAFIEHAKSINKKNTFGSIFDKDAFKVTYPFVPEPMRYFYRLANPLLCVLENNLTFFALSELKKINPNNDFRKVMVFAANENQIVCYRVKDKKIIVTDKELHELTQSESVLNGVQSVSDSFDQYIESLIGKEVL